MTLSKKIAYIDLNTGEIESKPIPLELRRKYIGGRGLDMYLLYNHIKPGIDPLGPDNVALISAGLLVGTPSSGTGRTHIAGKSPLTGYLGSSNMGGFFASELRFAGYDHLVITGKADKPSYLWIHDGEIEIRDATHLWELDTHATQQTIRDKHKDQEIQSLVIGPAGENLVRYANVMTSLKNAGGRTGMGALLGSKNLKAVAVRGTMDLKIAHPDEALAYNKRIIDGILSAKASKIMGRYGSPFIWGVTNSSGMVRVRNFQHNQLENATAVECEEMEKYSVGRASCFGCQMHCRGRHRIPDGPYKGTYGEGPEYTALGAFAGEVDCTNPTTVLVGNHLTNIYGLDNLETGSMIAWAMELYELGIITDKDTDGLKLKFGDDEVVIEMIGRIARREGLGSILAEGPLKAAAIIGKGSAKYLIHAKGMSNLHSDERSTPSLALGVGTSSRGADHIRSRAAIDLFGLPESLLADVYGQPTPYDGPMTSDYTSYDGKARQVLWQEMCYEAVDCLGICKYHTVFLGPNYPNFEEWSRLIYYNTGLEFSPLEIWEVADRAYTIERLFNLREGMIRADDMLVDRYYDEPTPDGIGKVRGAKIDRDKYNDMLDEYYEMHGWNKSGVPTKSTLKKLGLDKEPSGLI
ncbi:MAG: aldehyde ferredoxin oxidoreductase family protein [Chloroflexi bacterium]|jgi:aldehyde:ferredoxin oxidoreductase|nr:aldehyde ferredoxin oxidoreductase family protein [Chloroflexota bacterium]MBT7081274.1 aldehyde ferredoxin oxidoreductase family protein [Chloroflexota bacterium]MBT7288891.1 aldehyde ferredoxin oxidoreductase family protein [Chloroflexota bacterium]